jgi:hypothetical protein
VSLLFNNSSFEQVSNNLYVNLILLLVQYHHHLSGLAGRNLWLPIGGSAYGIPVKERKPKLRTFV